MYSNNVVIGLLALALLPRPAQAATVGFPEAQAARAYPQGTMDAIAQTNWYFAHASVGGNMMDGVARLHAARPTYYQLVGDDSQSGTPPVNSLPGRIYGNYRGNPSWQEKVSWFVGYVANGWRAPKVTFVANKFCWIDQEANLQTYLNSMSTLETANPASHFVYMTMPLTVNSDYQNYQRNVFNDGLRSWAAANNRLLFDVAAIESHAPDGTAQSYTWSGRTCQRLYAGYASDEGHLNGLGAETVALGFYAIAASQLPVSGTSDVPLLPPAGLAGLAALLVGVAAFHLRARGSARVAA